MNIPAGESGRYRFSQVDDYAFLSRGHFRHAPPLAFSLQARASASILPGTWGFGLWNDPFGFSLNFGGKVGRLPVLPNSVWFFHASPSSWLAISDGIPGNGFFAGTIHSPAIPSLLLAPALFTTPFMLLRPISRLLRKVASQISRQESAAILVDVTIWHEYSIIWLRESTEFKIDGTTIMMTSISPSQPLGLVLWIDNQYAAWNPEGRLGYGTLGNPSAWLEVKSIEMTG